MLTFRQCAQRGARIVKRELQVYRADMKTLLRKIPTGQYFQGPDRWTSNPSEGLNFKSIDRALDFVQTWGLQDVELAFAFTGPASVTSVPLNRIACDYRQKS